MDTISSAIMYFQKGGFVMYILLVCSIFVVQIAVERWMYFSSADAGRTFAESFAILAGAGRWGDAIATAKSSRGELPRLITAAAERIRMGDDRISTFLEVQSGIVLARFRRRLYYLSVIVTAAPLLGLLGTISGMISAFSVFNVESGHATAITGGVGEALIATAFGLCVAIVALLVHSYFTQRMDSIITDMEQCLSLVEGSADAIKGAAM